MAPAELTWTRVLTGVTLPGGFSPPTSSLPEVSQVQDQEASSSQHGPGCLAC